MLYEVITPMLPLSSVTSIGEAAFANCTSLTNVVIGSSVTNIGVITSYSIHYTKLYESGLWPAFLMGELYQWFTRSVAL